MKKIILLSQMCVLCFITFGQNLSYRAGNCKTKSDFCPKIALFHETSYNFAGLGINSVNLDIVLLCNRSNILSLRTGINYFSFPKIYSAGIPLEIDFMIGRGAWMFECGLGLDYLYFYKNYSALQGQFSSNVSYLSAMGRIGVRYEKINGLFFRAGYNPHCSIMNTYQELEPISKHRFLHMASIGLGYTFNN
ncbi:MAG: hypothetical protein PHR81_03355 [Bacteroidales bacterium]|jgi:hypothetical protein|nr:hypothetical protein [Bacteroidales bacterium]MDD4213828.1 hypothetical protein [Bacteroidales bacterium]